ncbi:MAG: hypothetical protein V1760_00460 [Candidatus Peregrinibacteria bacterium]
MANGQQAAQEGAQATHPIIHQGERIRNLLGTKNPDPRKLDRAIQKALVATETIEPREVTTGIIAMARGLFNELLSHPGLVRAPNVHRERLAAIKTIRDRLHEHLSGSHEITIPSAEVTQPTAAPEATPESKELTSELAKHTILANALLGNTEVLKTHGIDITPEQLRKYLETAFEGMPNFAQDLDAAAQILLHMETPYKPKEIKSLEEMVQGELQKDFPLKPRDTKPEAAEVKPEPAREPAPPAEPVAEKPPVEHAPTPPVAEKPPVETPAAKPAEATQEQLVEALGKQENLVLIHALQGHTAVLGMLGISVTSEQLRTYWTDKLPGFKDFATSAEGVATILLQEPEPIKLAKFSAEVQRELKEKFPPKPKPAAPEKPKAAAAPKKPKGATPEKPEAAPATAAPPAAQGPAEATDKKAAQVKEFREAIQQPGYPYKLLITALTVTQKALPELEQLGYPNLTVGAVKRATRRALNIGEGHRLPQGPEELINLNWTADKLPLLLNRLKAELQKESRQKPAERPRQLLNKLEVIKGTAIREAVAKVTKGHPEDLDRVLCARKLDAEQAKKGSALEVFQRRLDPFVKEMLLYAETTDEAEKILLEDIVKTLVAELREPAAIQELEAAEKEAKPQPAPKPVPATPATPPSAPATPAAPTATPPAAPVKPKPKPAAPTPPQPTPAPGPKGDEAQTSETKKLKGYPSKGKEIDLRHIRTLMDRVLENKEIYDEGSLIGKAIQDVIMANQANIDMSELQQFLSNPNIELNEDIETLIGVYSAKELKELQQAKVKELERKKEEIESRGKSLTRAIGADRTSLQTELDTLREERDELERQLLNIKIARQHRTGKRTYSSSRAVLTMINIYLRREKLDETTYARVFQETDKQIQKQREEAGIGYVRKYTVGWLKPSLPNTLQNLAQKDDFFKAIGADKMKELAKAHNDHARVEAWIGSLEGDEAYKQEKVVPRLIAYLEFAIRDGKKSHLNTASINRAIRLTDHLKRARHEHIKKKVDAHFQQLQEQGHPSEPIDRMTMYFNELEKMTAEQTDITQKFVSTHALQRAIFRGTVAAGATTGVGYLAYGLSLLGTVGAITAGSTLATGGGIAGLTAGLKHKGEISEETAKSLYKGAARGAATVGVGLGTAAVGLSLWPAAILAGVAGFSPELVRGYKKYHKGINKTGAGVIGGTLKLGWKATSWAVPTAAKGFFHLATLGLFTDTAKKLRKK